MPTRQIVFIRHAEKPTQSRDSDSPHLSAKGRLRSMFLAEYLLHPYDDFRAPTAAYAMVLGGGAHRSDRCYETMMPTIRASDPVMPLRTVHRSHTASIARELATAPSATATAIPKTVVVCWEHSRIVDMVNIIIDDDDGRSDRGAGPVSAWGMDPHGHEDDDGCFDATWVCDVTDATVRLRVYRQFDIDMHTHTAFYEHDRNKIFFEHTYSRDHDRGRGRGRGPSRNICVIS